MIKGISCIFREKNNDYKEEYNLLKEYFSSLRFGFVFVFFDTLFSESSKNNY